MKQNSQGSKKLAVRRQTLRALGALDLTQARGAGDTAATCVTHLVVESEATCLPVK
jgi:hypothetical protein